MARTWNGSQVFYTSLWLLKKESNLFGKESQGEGRLLVPPNIDTSDVLGTQIGTADVCQVALRRDIGVTEYHEY